MLFLWPVLLFYQQGKPGPGGAQQPLPGHAGEPAFGPFHVVDGAGGQAQGGFQTVFGTHEAASFQNSA